jgi:dihydroorotate dehydrogenase (NAD+) catalytic subunit
MAPPSFRYEENLQTKIGALTLDNPTILASGVLGVTAGGLMRAWKGGAGAVVTKTVGTKAQPGHPGPRIVGVRGGGLLNAMGLPNPGVKQYIPEIEAALKEGASVIGSIMGNTPAQYRRVAKQLTGTELAALELNVSCPHVGSLYAQGLQPDHVSAVVEAVVKTVRKKIPVWVKLPGSTDYPRLREVALAAEAAGAAAIVAINTLPAIALDAEAKRASLGGGIGGLSGPAIKPVALRVVWELYRSGLTIPIIGVGGILSGTDVIEFLLAGARAVQIGTGVLLQGPTIFKQICCQLVQYLQSHEINNLESLVGAIHENES